jgi:AraC-like DNA-binding protein
MSNRLQQIQNWPELARATNWSAALLAKNCGVSLRTLERYFLDEMGKCPKAWLSEQRQQRAIKLLQDGSTVKEMSSNLGYKHTQHFSRDFKAFWGQRPTNKILTMRTQNP